MVTQGELLKGRSILIVDDNEMNIDILARRLRVRGCLIATALSAHAARIILAQQPIDLVLLDVNMPEVTGTDLLAEIRRTRGPAELPIIMVSADETRDTMLSTLRLGANDYVCKPVDYEGLVARVAVQLQVREAFRRAANEQARLLRRLHWRGRLEKAGFGDGDKSRMMIHELLEDLARGRLELRYQPQVRLRDKVIDTAEALLRWTSDVFGEVPASQFIPLAEESGDIAALTEWAVAQALIDHERFTAAGHNLRLAVNLSGALASDEAFMTALLAKIGDRTNAIALELTESADFGNGEEAAANLRRCADAGVRIAIDDYGAGLSSLAYIQKLPAHELKIDRLFISHLTDSHRDPLIVRSTIDLARALELEVVAEGVEDAPTLALLAAMGCDIAQGFFIAKPMDVDQLITSLNEGAFDRLTKAGAAQSWLQVS